MKVLIADDSPVSRVVLRRTLTRWGYEVIEAENGDQAWAILSAPDGPHLAILDWVMPGLTGPEVCGRLRESRREPYTYVLLLTSKTTKEETVEGMEAGADDYVVKPFHEHELMVRLRAGRRIVELQGDLLNAREELRERANKDLLTLLPNRQAIETELVRELSRCHRDGTKVGIVLLDLDLFKGINDNYGHFAGDAVLRETARRLRANMRDYDMVGRYGGEEFLVVLPGCDLALVCQQAERLRLVLCGTTMNVEGVEMTVSASFGVTVSDGSDRHDVFVRVADEALYRAKALGRNCISAMTIEESAKRTVQVGAT
jgi:two-component system cell cycle response regulator